MATIRYARTVAVGECSHQDAFEFDVSETMLCDQGRVQALEELVQAVLMRLAACDALASPE